MMNFIHKFLKWGWYLGCTLAVLIIYFHWLLELHSSVLALAAGSIVFAFSCAIGELSLTFSGDLNDSNTT